MMVVVELIIDEWDCVGCGSKFTRPRARGQRPKWCEYCRVKRNNGGVLGSGICVMCGSRNRSRLQVYCSRECGNRDRRSFLRRAIEDGDDWPGVIQAIKKDCLIDSNGCWLWKRKRSKGYPNIQIAGRDTAVHRISLRAKLNGADLGSDSAHHICAVEICVNPDHLQKVSDRENIAEMLARQFYLKRIRELESALREIDPCHPILEKL